MNIVHRISRGRRLIENVFGILCAKWRLLLRPIETEVNTAIDITKAIVVLHNFLIDEGKNCSPSSMADKQNEEGQEQENGEWRNELNGASLESSQHLAPHHVNWPNDAKEIRQILITYFNSPLGAVSWQDQMI
jgi:hypothetical protein